MNPVYRTEVVAAVLWLLVGCGALLGQERPGGERRSAPSVAFSQSELLYAAVGRPTDSGMGRVSSQLLNRDINLRLSGWLDQHSRRGGGRLGEWILRGTDKLNLDRQKVRHIGKLMLSAFQLALLDIYSKGNLAVQTRGRPSRAWGSNGNIFKGHGYSGFSISSIQVVMAYDYASEQPGSGSDKFRYFASQLIISQALEHFLYWALLPATGTPQVNTHDKRRLSYWKGRYYNDDPSGRNDAPWMSARISGVELSPTALVSRYVFGAQPGAVLKEGIITTIALSTVAAYFVLPDQSRITEEDRAAVKQKFSSWRVRPQLYYDTGGGLGDQGIVPAPGQVRLALGLQARWRDRWIGPLLYQDGRGQPNMQFTVDLPATREGIWRLGLHQRYRPWNGVRQHDLSAEYVGRRRHSPFGLGTYLHLAAEEGMEGGATFWLGF